MTSGNLQTIAIIRLWVPLALTWAMMAAEGVILQSVLSRLQDAATNLAAFGVAISIAFIIEAPVIMLLSASTAYVLGSRSYRIVRALALALSFGTSCMMGIAVLPPVYAILSKTILALPPSITDHVYWSLVALIPWPGAIGIRRFYQGVIIKRHMNHLVALGTTIRLLSIIAGSILALRFVRTSYTAPYACGVLAFAVTAEMIATWWMARYAVRSIQHTNSPRESMLTFRRLVALYIPLAMTSLITMGLGPVFAAFMTRFPNAVASLAVFPIIDNTVFQFRSPLFAYQEVAISLYSRHGLHEKKVAKAAYGIATIATGLLLVIATTPLSDIVFGVFPYHLDTSLHPMAAYGMILLLPLPIVSAIYSVERSVLIVSHHTNHVTYSTLLEAGVTIGVMSLAALLRINISGVYLACVAMTAGKITAAVYLLFVGRYYRSARD